MNDLEEQKKADTQAFAEEIKKVAESFPNHTMKEFTFSKFEQQLLAEQVTIAKLAEGTSNKLINELCLKRVGITPSSGMNVRYAIGLGRFVVFTPKSTQLEK